MANSEREQEQQRVTRVIKTIKNQIASLQAEYEKTHQDTRRLQKDYSANVSLNFFEVDDRTETKTAVQQHRSLVSQQFRTEHFLKHEIEQMKQLRTSPYFGRIDLTFPHQKKLYKLYLGTHSCVDAKDHFLVFDWRAPIASAYYNGTLGPVKYRTPSGQRITTLKKKRQFQIENGRIKNMFDTNEIVGDEMLQHVLGEKNDRVMHNIVSTIQSHQNDIIRDTQSDLLVVQGVAGSGKTSTILQRIAFLLYHSRKSLDVKQILLFSPNRLFSHYISEVLPSLGEHNMRQVTWSDFVKKRFEGLNVENIFERYEHSADLTAEQRKVQNFKASQNFIEQLKAYCQHLTAKKLAFNRILYQGRVFFGKLTIETLYAAQPEARTVADKFLHVKNSLIQMLKNRLDAEAERPEIQKEVDTLSSLEYNQLFVSEAAQKIRSTNGKRHYVAFQLAKNHLREVYSAIFNDEYFDPYVQYQQFLKQITLPQNISKAVWQKSRQRFSQLLELHRLKLSDATPLMYLRDLITGSGQNHQIKDLFLDEMQDYSIAQLMYLKHAFPVAKFNLVGDSEQTLYKDVEDPDVLLKHLKHALSAERPRLIRLTRSYRSTYPITTFAKHLLPHSKDIRAFHRDGPLPRIMISSNWSQAIHITQQIAHQNLKKYDTVAIITKDLEQAKRIYAALIKEKQVTLMSDQDRSLPRGIVILPVYLAKGLEFDAVIGWNVSKGNYDSQILLGLLYTIATRAMHSLTLLSIGNVSPLITNSHVTSKEFRLNYQPLDN